MASSFRGASDGKNNLVLFETRSECGAPSLSDHTALDALAVHVAIFKIDEALSPDLAREAWFAENMTAVSGPLAQLQMQHLLQTLGINADVPMPQLPFTQQIVETEAS